MRPARRPARRPGCTIPTSVIVISASRVELEMPAAAASTSRRTSSGRRSASRSATAPPSECPNTSTGAAVEAGRGDRVGVGGETSAPAGSGDEAAWPGRSGISSRPAGQERRQLAEVPGGAAVPVDRAAAAGPSPPSNSRRRAPAMLDPALLEARQRLLASVTSIDYCVSEHELVRRQGDASEASRPAPRGAGPTSPPAPRARRAFSCFERPPSEEGARWQTT